MLCSISFEGIECNQSPHHIVSVCRTMQITYGHANAFETIYFTGVLTLSRNAFETHAKLKDLNIPTHANVVMQSLHLDNFSRLRIIVCIRQTFKNKHACVCTQS